MQHYTYSFILYLIVTLFTESVTVFLLLRFSFGVKKQLLSGKEILSATVFANLLTLPYVWFVFPYLIINFFTAIWISEILVFIVEAIFYKIYLRLSYRNALLVSLIANVVSFGIGKLLHTLLGNG